MLSHLCLFILILTFTPANKAGGKTLVTLGDFLSAFEKKNNLKKSSRNLSDLSQARFLVQDQLFKESSVSGKTEFGKEKKLELSFGQVFALGRHSGARLEAIKLDEKVSLLEAEIMVAEHEARITKLYLELASFQQKYLLAKTYLTLLQPLASLAENAAAKGILEPLALKKWKILLENLRSDKELANLDFVHQISLLNTLTGAKIKNHPDSFSLQNLPANFAEEKFDASRYVPLLIMDAKQKGLQEKSAYQRGRREISTEIGGIYDLEKKEMTYLAGISVPVGTDRLNNLEVAEILKERELLITITEQTLMIANQKYSIIGGKIKRLGEALRFISKKVSSLQSLLKTTQSAFKNGRANISDLMETLRELYEKELTLLEIAGKLEELSAEAHYFLKGANE